MATGKRRFEPADAGVMPRFADIATFMRLPRVVDPREVDIALVGVPFDGATTNRPGTRHGPREIRNMSSLMRRVNAVTGVAPYELCAVGDLGDVSVNPVDLMETLRRIEAFFADLHEAGALPLTAGGDHLITLPIMRALARERPVGLIQFDSHSDTWDVYFGGSRYTHGTPFRRAVEEGLLDPRRAVQIGIRGSLYQADDLDWPRSQGFRIITIDEFHDLGVHGVIAEARRVLGDGPTYVSFDVDGLDPAYAPGTGTPEIGGFTTYEALRMLRGLRGLNFVGGDVVEVSPPFDVQNMTAIVGATVMFELLCLFAERLGGPVATS